MINNGSKNRNNIRNTKVGNSLIIFIYVFLPITAFFCNVFLKLESAVSAWHSINAEYLVSDGQSAWLLCGFIVVIASLALLMKIFNQEHLFKHLAIATGISAALSIVGIFISDEFWMFAEGQKDMSSFYGYLSQEWWLFCILFIVLAAAAILKIVFKKKQFSEAKSTSGKFGSAAWANREDLEELGAYSDEKGTLIGLDEEGKELYVPFINKLTISPPGGGKTACSSIPILLSYDGPAFVFDVKGELWATTARYRAKELGHQVIVIDPYNVTKGPDFIRNKPFELHVEHQINPFDFIPEDEKVRDRMINAFASSFIITDIRGGSKHFDENARILIRGFIDFMMKSYQPEERTLAALYVLLSEGHAEAKETFKDMAELSGRAGAASNQVNRVGMNERGSILSTSYRQIDWMSDSNMQHVLCKSNFDLRDFLKGNMDIFVVLPEDQIKEHGRLVRMIMALLMGIIVQANPSDLPKKKILFLLEELAQLGYCPDVEQSIEVLRARGVVVWTVFQSLSQIEMFQKPDLFKGVQLKQIFTLDDVPTMQWIQALGGKQTVINKTLSANKGDSRRKMQAFGGTVSQGAGESVQETAADLIQINEIRELPIDEQFVFLHGQKPIRCKKAYYFEHEFFVGKYDYNPLGKKEEKKEEEKK